MGGAIGSPGAQPSWEAQVSFFLTQKEKLRQPCPLSPSLGASPSDSGVAGPRVRRLWRGYALQRRLVERQLLVAMSPWVGDVVLPRTPRRPAAVHTRGI